MLAYLAEYSTFLLELLTIAAIVVVSFLIILSAAKKPHDQSHLTVEHLNESVEQRADAVRRTILGKRDSRKFIKERKKEAKRNQAAGDESGGKRRRLFVLDFKGDIRATATASLREEISAIIKIAEKGDEVLVRLENAGGAVHEHGLAASQLLRLRARGIPLTVAVDKVAASGGYLMACAADKIVAAPFAVIGSIGVLMQMPNFHRLLDEKGIDFEQITAGRFKRTLTVFGENTDEAREKVKEELLEVHSLFQNRIKELRPSVDLEQVATGEHWYGDRAIELNLIDAIGTSDDYLLSAADTADLYRLSFKRQLKFLERMLHGVEGLLSR